MSTGLYILFWLHKAKKDKNGRCPLIVRLTFQKNRRQITTRFRISETEWIIAESHQKTKNKEIISVREFVTSFRTRIYSLSNKLELENRLTIDELIDLYEGKENPEKSILELIEEHNQKLKERVGIDRAGSTFEKYVYLKDKVKRFINVVYNKRDLLLNKIPPSFIKDFVHHLITKDGNQHNTVAKYVKNLKHVFAYAVEQGHLEKHPFETFKMGYKDIQRTYLTAQELDTLAAYKFANKKFELVKDLFIFQCYTGLAYVDMAKLKIENVVEGIDKKPWIVTHRQKTKKQSLIPLLQPAIDVIEKYKNHNSKNDYQLLPAYAIQKFNTYLKEVSAVVGIEKSLSSHAGRRTFATTIALGNGVSIESISKVLGHSNTKMTSIYAIVTDTKLSEEMAQLGNKLKKCK
ncbi:MAG: site-specific integrase [Flavisolibacter sp.]